MILVTDYKVDGHTKTLEKPLTVKELELQSMQGLGPLRILATGDFIDANTSKKVDGFYGIVTKG